MSKLTKRFIREDVHTPFYSETNELVYSYIKTTYIDTRRIISQTAEISVDSTTITVTMLFRSTDDFIEFALDKYPLLGESNRKRHLYNLRNNIKTETIFIEE